MTDNYIRRAANALPNKHEDATALTVEQIMRERGVGRRQAYFRLRQMRGEQEPKSPSRPTSVTASSSRSTAPTGRSPIAAS